METRRPDLFKKAKRSGLLRTGMRDYLRYERSQALLTALSLEFDEYLVRRNEMPPWEEEPFLADWYRRWEEATGALAADTGGNKMVRPSAYWCAMRLAQLKILADGQAAALALAALANQMPPSARRCRYRHVINPPLERRSVLVGTCAPSAPPVAV